MELAALFFGIVLGIAGWGFLAATVTAYPEIDKSLISSVPWPVLFVDFFVSVGLLSITVLIVRNWRIHPELRRLAKAGYVCLFSGIALVLLAFTC